MGTKINNTICENLVTWIPILTKLFSTPLPLKLYKERNKNPGELGKDGS